MHILARASVDEHGTEVGSRIGEVCAVDMRRRPLWHRERLAPPVDPLGGALLLEPICTGEATDQTRPCTSTTYGYTYLYGDVHSCKDVEVLFRHAPLYFYYLWLHISIPIGAQGRQRNLREAQRALALPLPMAT